MFKNYLKIAFRNLLKYKKYSLINIIGLAIGFATSFLILLWVMEESSFDKFHENGKSIHMVLLDEQRPDGIQTISGTPGPLAEALKAEFPEVVKATRVKYTDKFLVSYEDKYFIEKNILGVDPDFLKMFSFPLLQGNPEKVLNEPNSIVITQKMAIKYFGNSDPIGKTLHFDPVFDFVVKGVLQNPPSNSQIRFDFLLPIETFMIRYSSILDNWSIPDAGHTFIQLAEGESEYSVEEKISSIIKRHSNENITIKLFPFLKLHNHPEYALEPNYATPLKMIYIYLAIAILILIIACFNFINLISAQFLRRFDSFAMIKLFGANRMQMIGQFLTDSFMITSLAFILAIGLIELFIPILNQISGNNFNHIPLHHLHLWLMYIGLTILVGSIAGIWPMLLFDQSSPVSIFRNKSLPGSRNFNLRKASVILQFTLSIIFIIYAWFIFSQLKYMQQYDPGYDSKNVIAVPLQLHWAHREDGKFYKTMKHELISCPGVEGVTQSCQPPGDIITSVSKANWEGKKPAQSGNMNWLTVHYDFFEMMDIPLIEGRTFSKDYVNDMSTWKRGSYIINESAAKMIGPDSPIDKWFELFGRKGQIIGVVRDFHYRDLTKGISPLAIFIHPFYNNVILIKIHSKNKSATISQIRKIWNKHSHNYPFSYSFVDEFKEKVYREERQSLLLLNSFSIFAVIIACLGLFGMTGFSVQKRTREIGIRKVMGASVKNIWKLLIKKYIKWIIIANLIAWPIAWYVVRKWLQNYAYRIDITIWPFFLAGFIVIIIAMLTVSWQALRAVTANPVDSLRYE